MQYDVAYLLDVTDVLEAGKFEYGIVLLCWLLHIWMAIKG